MAVSKYVTTAEYLIGLRAFVRGLDRECPFSDKVRATRWNAGWDNASKSPVSTDVRNRRRAAVGQLMIDGAIRYYVSIQGECVMCDTFADAVRKAA